MPDPLDVLFEHGGTTEPDPAFRVALMERVRAALTSPDVPRSAPSKPHPQDLGDVSTDGRRGVGIELEPADSQRPRERRRGRRVFRAALGVAAAGATIFAVVVARDRTSRPDVSSAPGELPPNGWVAFTERDSEDDLDVYLVREGESPRRVGGSDTDTSSQACPAFAPDGGRLVFGQVTGSSRSGYDDDAELVIIEVGADGSTAGTTTIRVEDLGAPPCPIWSPDGRWLAFGAGSEVWLVDTVTEELRRLAGYAATDLEWLPGTDDLAIADNGIHVYSVTTSDFRSLDLEGAAQLAWSPDGTTVAFTQLDPSTSGDARYEAHLWLADADGTNQRQIATYNVTHGIGPVWSPDGRYIAYQRAIEGRCCELHEVVLIPADDNDRRAQGRTDVVVSPPTTPGSDRPVEWYPYSVTWSPDGSTLLYAAWNDACAAIVPDVEGTVADEGLDNYVSAECGGRPEGSGVLAVPVDTTKAPFVLADASSAIGVKDGQPWLPMQTWGRRPLD